VKFRTPANVLLRRAQLTLILAALLPTILTTPVGVFLLVTHASRSVTIVSALLVLAFCTSSLTGYILGSILVSRGASLAKVQNDFLSGVSHELSTPITSVRMFVDTLRSGRVTDDDERRRCLALMDREMARLDELVARLLSLSRLESGRQPFVREPVPIGAVVDEALQAFEVLHRGAELELVVDVDRELETVGDRTWLAQALGNLLSNAWKYGPDAAKKIVVRGRASGRRYVAIEVEDNGPGVSPDERRRIFDQFERGGAAVGSRASGYGLGLAMVRAIVRLHRGRIELHSDGGARFRMILPRRTFRHVGAGS
jgi:two-component system, OmpR family, phosphate regulon sensor histidine kinase PhoR